MRHWYRRNGVWQEISLDAFVQAVTAIRTLVDSTGAPPSEFEGMEFVEAGDDWQPGQAQTREARATVRLRTGTGRIYIMPLGTPLYWRDDVSGVLPAAVNAYLAHAVGDGPAPSAAQLALIAEFLSYYADAPCWRDSSAMLADLRARARHLASFEEVRRWIHDALRIGLDPL